MRNRMALVVLTLISITALVHASTPQNIHPALSVKKIMQDPRWIGSSPSRIQWSLQSDKLYFFWNPDSAVSDSLYCADKNGKNVHRASRAAESHLPWAHGVYNRQRSMYAYEKKGDIFVYNIQDGRSLQITSTSERESHPFFTKNGRHVGFLKKGDLFLMALDEPWVRQLTIFRKGKAPDKESMTSWFQKQQLNLSAVLKRRHQRNMQLEENKIPGTQDPAVIYTGSAETAFASLSPNEQYICFAMAESPAKSKNTFVPDFVTETGYTESIPARPKVGAPQSNYTLAVYDRIKQRVSLVSADGLPGMKTAPDTAGHKEKIRSVFISQPVWHPEKECAIVNIFSNDHKDRWITVLYPDSAVLELIDHQHDDAWIGGPGIVSWRGTGTGWMPDKRSVWFQSEETGYSHLYVYDTVSRVKNALTSGRYEVYSPRVSRNGKWWYFSANIGHPGIRNFYRMDIGGGTPRRLTAMNGRNDVWLSPDETMMAVRHSEAARPWELYVAENRPGAKPRRVVKSTTGAFDAYPWRTPAVISFRARDSVSVYARLYEPEDAEPGAPAVIFVHGAGYLQNAHTWWSSYFREYMFHNLLADKGYFVLDIDYRGSAGYGRDFRTAIYRNMGGKDLSDQIDGARYLVDSCGVSRQRIGIYGGSYGGFITLMALFRYPDTFAAGAALRSVTDWSHYNHWYTSRILNCPENDSLAYTQSSPIYYAEGLAAPLLMCHGMVDTNVHFQDIVRLCQRLIELGKEDWELAVYPVESHGFREPSSWTDEYRRILKLFDTNLKK